MEWPLNAKHPVYGVVVMAGCIRSEPYRWFDNNGLISMIPLSALAEKPDTKQEGACIL